MKCKITPLMATVEYWLKARVRMYLKINDCYAKEKAMYRLDKVAPLKCIGCEINCAIKDKPSYCLEKNYAIWPDTNNFFKIAINNLAVNKIPCYIADVVVFVDFSIDNIQFFLKPDWLEHLVETGAKLVIIVERDMLPLANYWSRHTDSIIAIINVDNGLNDALRNARRALAGRKCVSSKLPSVTSKEMAVLSLVAEGNSVHDIAKNLQCTTKSVYEHQYSLRKKFGGIPSLRHLRFVQHAL